MDRVGPPLLQLSRTQQLQPSLLELLEQLIVDVKASSIASGSSDDVAADNKNDDSDSDDDYDDDEFHATPVRARNPYAYIYDDDDDVDLDDYAYGHEGDYEGDDAAYTRLFHWSLRGVSREMKNKQRHQRRLAVLECLLRKEHLPIRQRNLIDNFVDRFHETINSDIHDMITNQRDPDTVPQGTLLGLDIGRDTHAEVETILRIFPDQIKQRKATKYINDYDDETEEFVARRVEVDYIEEGDYPIQCLSVFRDEDRNAVSNTNAIPFIHVFAKLAIEFNSFKKHERGGLLLRDVTTENDVFENLSHANFTATYDSEDCDFLDEVRTTEFNRLQQMGLIVADDIRKYCYPLVHLCEHDFFPEKSARFLIEWCPECLVEPLFWIRELESWYTPLYTVVLCHGSLQSFRFIFEYLIRYYPYKKGISQLFQKRNSNDGTTPLQVACGTPYNPLKRNRYMAVIEEVLSEYSGSTPINATDAIITAAIDPSIHLDGVYFLMRRQPDALISMIKSTSRSTTTGVLKNDDSHQHHGRNTNNNTFKNRRGVYGSNRRDNDRDNNDRNDDNDIHKTTKKGKRKRK